MKHRLPPPERHRWLDHWLLPSGAALDTLSDVLRGHLEAHEAAEGTRTRACKPADSAAFYAFVGTITTNLAVAVLGPPSTGALAARRGMAGAG